MSLRLDSDNFEVEQDCPAENARRVPKMRTFAVPPQKNATPAPLNTALLHVLEEEEGSEKSYNVPSVEFSGMQLPTRLNCGTTVHETGDGPRSTKYL